MEDLHCGLVTNRPPLRGSIWMVKLLLMGAFTKTGVYIEELNSHTIIATMQVISLAPESAQKQVRSHLL